MRTGEVIKALGGVDNIEKIGKDATRLKVWVKDTEVINQNSGIFRETTAFIKCNLVQMILGEEVESVFVKLVNRANETTKIHIEGCKPSTPKNRTRREIEEFKVTVKLSLFVGAVVGVIMGIFIDRLIL